MPPPKPTSRPRQIFIGVLIFLGVLVLAVVTSPWWWHLPARSLFKKEGVTFARFENTGFKRFTLHDVVVKQPGLEVTLATVTADTPLFWLRRAWFSQPGPVLIDRWQLRLLDNAPKNPATPPALNGWPDLRTQLESIAPKLAQWLPGFRATSGTILAGKESLTLASLHWLARDARLKLDGLQWRTHTADAEAHWDAAANRLLLTATSTAATPTPASAAADSWRLQLSANEKVADAQLQLWGQSATATARFAPTGWMPAEAELAAPAWELPASRLRLGTAYAHVSGEAFLSWKQDRFTTRIKAASQPLPESDVPPLRVEISGEGDPQKLQLNTVDVFLPGTTARLLSPIVLTRDGQIESAKSRFSVEADLSQLPWPGASGRVTGEALFSPDASGNPHVTAHFEASDVNALGTLIKKATLDAEQNGPLLELKKAELALADGSRLELSGNWDWAARTLSKGVVAGDLKAAALARWLPAGTTFDRLEIEAKAEGRWPALAHAGKVNVAKLQLSSVKPIALQAAWKGTGTTLEPLSLDAKAGDSRLTAEGSLSSEALTLTRAELVLADERTLKLAQPSAIRWAPHLTIEKLELTGDNSRVAASLRNGPGGRAELIVENVESAWLRDFLPPEKLSWKIAALSFAGTWPDGALQSSAQLKASLAIAAGKEAQIELNARTDTRGVLVERLLISDERGPVAQAAGTVPLVVRPLATPQWTLDPAAAWAVKFSTSPESAFWAAQAEVSGIVLRAPLLSGEISGSLQKPDAQLQVRADEIVFKEKTWPAITGLSGALSVDDRTIVLRELSARAAGQPFSAKGKTSYDPARVQEILRNPQLLWSDQGEVTIVIPPLQLASLGSLLPEMLAPTGEFSGDVTLSGNRELKGTLTLKGAATLPVAPLGSVTEINGEAVFSGRRLELRKLTALAGGQPLKAGGWIEIPHEGPVKIDFSLDGKNLHLARQAGLLIRGDVVLHAKTGDGDRTTITGDVRLHDSLFLRDVRSMLPGRGPGGAASRPPYFSVEKAPFNDWRLDVTVKGERFMRLRTLLFNGVASTDLHVTGTLAEPQSVGTATVNQGNIVLPFASFRVTSGTVRLTQADPYTPQLAMNAETRSLGYDLRMELSGPANDPALTFTSSPPLASEQVLLMVMAGETPSSEISYSTTQRAQSIGRYLGKSLFSGIFGSDDGGSERLSFTSGENVTEQGRETFIAEYRLNEDWSVVGEYDEYDEYNIGFRRKIFARKKADQPEEKKP